MIKRCSISKMSLLALNFTMLLLVTLLAACSNGDQAQQTKNPLSTSAVVPSSNSATAEPENTNLQPSVADGFKLPVRGLRPIAVMIDNEGTRVLPQGGLDKAQVIYEVIVEGGETRLMAVFWDMDPTMIGPVRSSRDYFLDYAMENDAIYVHYGWSPKAKKDISNLKINNINGISNAGEIFWDLTKDKRNWQDTYTSMQNILEKVKKLKYRTDTTKEPVFKYNASEVAALTGEKAEKISITYSTASTCGYEYDSASKSYIRFRKGKPQMERVTGKQLRAENIIIQLTQNKDIKGDNKGRQELDTTGSGKGYYITCGRVQNIKWSKADRSARTRYTDESGAEILLNPGQTWVQILPLFGKVVFE